MLCHVRKFIRDKCTTKNLSFAEEKFHQWKKSSTVYLKDLY